MSKKKKKIKITIEFDLERKFCKVVDYDYKGNGGAMSGGYKDKQDFLNAFNDYFEKYICIDLEEKQNTKGE